MRRFAIRPRPVTAVKAPRRTDDLETSVPVFGNCCLDLVVGPASFPTCEVECSTFDSTSELDTEALSEATPESDVLIEVDIDTDVEVDILRLVDCEALSLKLKFGLSVLLGTDMLVLADWLALVDADSEALVLAD